MLENNLIPLYSKQDIEQLSNGFRGSCKEVVIAELQERNKIISERNREIMNTLNKPFTCML